jgi:hypothetical protein
LVPVRQVVLVRAADDVVVLALRSTMIQFVNFLSHLRVGCSVEQSDCSVEELRTGGW